MSKGYQEDVEFVAATFPAPLCHTLLPCIPLDTAISPAATGPRPWRNGRVLGDLLPSPDSPDPAAIVEAEDFAASIARVLGTLESRARRVIELRFGFTGRSHTLEEIGIVFGVTRERIRQIENKALKHITPGLRELVDDQFGSSRNESLRPRPEAGSCQSTATLVAPKGPEVPVAPAPGIRADPPRAASGAPFGHPPAGPRSPAPSRPRVQPEAGADSQSVEDRLIEAILGPLHPPVESARPTLPPTPAPSQGAESSPAPPPRPPAAPLERWLHGWRARRFAIVDRRPEGGHLWVRDPNMGLASEIEELRAAGIWFSYGEDRDADAWGWWLRSDATVTAARPAAIRSA